MTCSHTRLVVLRPSAPSGVPKHRGFAAYCVACCKEGPAHRTERKAWDAGVEFFKNAAKAATTKGAKP